MREIFKKQENLSGPGKDEIQVVEFLLANEHFGTKVGKVREIIRGNCPLVAVPDAPACVIGVVNLREKIIPVVDLAQYLHMDVKRGERASRIIICDCHQMTVGFWVSAVMRVHRVLDTHVEKPSDFLKTENAYTVGIIKIDTRILFILDLEKLASDIINHGKERIVI